MVSKPIHPALVALALVGISATLVAQTPGTAFLYQGRLDNAGVPASGSHDMRFQLCL